jgi:hypothetical protein
MGKQIFSIFFFVLLVSHSFSQSNYKEGYIITLQQDTVSGWLDFRTDQTNARLCRFKRTEHGAEEIFHPGEIAGYRFIREGKYYVTKQVKIDNEYQTFFLEFLIQGLKNLYYLPLDNGYFYFEGQDGMLVGVTKQPDQITENYKVKEDNRYKGVMSYLFYDCLPLSMQTARVAFDKGSMIVFTKKYHDQMCDTGEECIIFENDYKRKFIKFDYTIFTGAELNDVKLVNTYFPSMLSISPVIGGGLNISSPRLMKSLYFNIETSISAVSGISNYIDNYLNYCLYDFNAGKISIGAGLEYIYDKGRFRPAAGAGISFHKLFNLTDTLKINDRVSSYQPLFRTSTTGLKAELGFDYQTSKDQFVVVRLSFFAHRKTSTESSNLRLKLGYKF